MKMDITEALKAPFRENWITKAIGGGILLLIPIINLFVFGFAVKYLKNVSNKINDIPSITDNTFLTGLKFGLGSFLLEIPVLLLSALAAVTMLNQNASTIATGTIVNIIANILSLAIIILLPALVMNFSNNENMTSLIDFNIAIAIIKRNVSSYLIMLFYALLILIIYSIIETICMITIIGIILIPPLLVLQTISLMHLLGQYIVIIKYQQ